MEAILYRFQKLYEQSRQNKKLDQLPTILAVVSMAHATIRQNEIVDFTINIIKRHKPKRILFANSWIAYYCKSNCLDFS